MLSHYGMIGPAVLFPCSSAGLLGAGRFEGVQPFRLRKAQIFRPAPRPVLLTTYDVNTVYN
jgi:hypothetical protein